MDQNRKKVLVAESDPDRAALLNQLLTYDDFDVTLVENGKQALDLISRDDFDLLIAGLGVVSGNGGVAEKIYNNPLSPAMMIEVPAVNNGEIPAAADEYYTQPVHADEFLLKVNKALQVAAMGHARREREAEREAIEKHNKQFQVKKDMAVVRPRARYDRTLLYSLKSSFNQGAGFGSLVSLISLMEKSLKKENDKYVVNAGYMDLLLQNSRVAERSLQAISELYSLIDYEPELEERSVAELYELAKSVFLECEKYKEIKTNAMVFHEADQTQANLMQNKLTVDLSMLEKAIRELTMNALKFSAAGTEIGMLTSVSSNCFYLSVVNKPDASLFKDDIPGNYEEYIFEPFFRLANFVYEEYGTNDFGLGLTMVEKIVKKNNGKISILRLEETDQNETGKTGQAGTTETDHCLALEISFPLAMS